MLVKHSFYVTVPISFVYTLATHHDKEFMSRTKFRNWPWRRFTMNYFGILAVVNMLLHLHSLVSIDYCSRSSVIYECKHDIF